MSRLEGSAAYPSYPERANFSYTFLQNMANRLHDKQKDGSSRRVNPPPGRTPGDSWGGGVPPGSSNPGPISDPKMSYFTPVFRPGL